MDVRIVEADAALAEKYQAEIPELVHATGPVSYDYHFPKRSIFDEMVALILVRTGHFVRC